MWHYSWELCQILASDDIYEAYQMTQWVVPKGIIACRETGQTKCSILHKKLTQTSLKHSLCQRSNESAWFLLSWCNRTIDPVWDSIVIIKSYQHKIKSSTLSFSCTRIYPSELIVYGTCHLSQMLQSQLTIIVWSPTTAKAKLPHQLKLWAKDRLSFSSKRRVENCHNISMVSSHNYEQPYLQLL